MQTCPAGEVRGSKRKDFERSFLGGTARFGVGGAKTRRAKIFSARGQRP